MWKQERKRTQIRKQKKYLFTFGNPSMSPEPEINKYSIY